MSQESIVMSHEQSAAELAGDFVYINFRTIDFDDAVDVAIDNAEEVLTELDEVNVSTELKDQAAFCVAQYFLDELARLETHKIAEDLAGVVEANRLGKPYMVMVRLPDAAGVTNG